MGERGGGAAWTLGLGSNIFDIDTNFKK